MQTKVIKESELSLAIASLQRGEPVVFPTETVYGLGAPLFNKKAVKRVFAIKKRPLDNPLIAHIAWLEQAQVLSSELSFSFYRLAERFWPGPLTLVVKRKEEVPPLISAGHPTVAIRMPAHPVARKLIEAIGEPLVAPSANLSGRPSPTRLEDVLEDLNGKVQYVIDGGECDLGIESTVLSLYHSTPTLLRPGQITKEMLELVLGESVLLASDSEVSIAPGMKYRHYAPKAMVRLVYQLQDIHTHAFILSSFPIPGKKTYRLNAKTLYSQLRTADRLCFDQIDVYCDEIVRNDPALMNRLLRASME